MNKRVLEEIDAWGKLLILLALAIVVVVAGVNLERLRMYQTYFSQTSPSVTMRYEQLSGSMDEAAVRAHFAGITLTCMPEPPAPQALGDRVCFAATDLVDGVPALGMAAFFQRGQLRHTLVQVPWWRHLRQKTRLQATYGLPRLLATPGEPVLQTWKLSGGLLVFNEQRTRNLDPLAWSIVMWNANETGWERRAAQPAPAQGNTR